MSNELIKEAKKIYIETGRINRKIISKEIAISWYKCKLQNLEVDHDIRVLTEKPVNSFEQKFTRFIDSIVGDQYQYILVNNKLDLCSSRLNDEALKKIESIDDSYIGTNGGYIAFKTGITSTVSLEEHYLNLLSPYYTIGINIKITDEVDGVLMIISDLIPNEYEVNRVLEKINNYQFQSNQQINKTNIVSKNYNTNDFLTYPSDYSNLFDEKVEKSIKTFFPILVMGDQGSGKSSLCYYLGIKKGEFPNILDFANIPKVLHRQALENSLFHNETLIVESLNDGEIDALKLLTVYSDKVISNSNVSKYSDFKCKNLILSILTTAENNLEYASENLNASNKLINQLIDKLRLNTIKLINYYEFKDQQVEIINKLIISRNISLSGNQFNRILKSFKEKTFKDLIEFLEKQSYPISDKGQKLLNDSKFYKDNSLKSLEEQEKEYILSIYELMEENIMTTSEILKIGRSTLYRKLEKYQNETLVK